MSTFFGQELEKLASRKLRISAKETMKTAEKLYTQGYVISYFIHMSVVYSSVSHLPEGFWCFPIQHTTKLMSWIKCFN